MLNRLRRWNYIRKQKIQKDMMNNILSAVDFTEVENIVPKKIESIMFVLPGMMAYSGGHTSVLRLGTALEKKGYKVRYVSFVQQELEEQKKNAEINLKGYKGEIISNDKIYEVKNDIVVATSWDSVYYAKKAEGYKMYFVQDYEPFFHMYGEMFLLAQKTYELGLHMVSLGKWNKYMVEKNCDIKSNIDFVTFPYEASEYFEIPRDYSTYKNKKEFTMAVYVKDTGKRAPYLLQHMMVKLKESLNKDNIVLNIKYYGENLDFKCEGGENLGKLSKKQLLELYQTSDFGMVASLTNISLVPYEMLATGLPLVELKEGTFKYFFPEGCSILTSFDYNELYSKIKECINEPEKLQHMRDKSIEYLNTLSWEKTSNEFEEILNNVVKDKE
ncbi:hypothetical protein ABFP60_16945 [Clostridioides difficile]